MISIDLICSLLASSAPGLSCGGVRKGRKDCNYSLLLRRFVFCMAEASAKRVTGDHYKPQGTMGRVQTAGEARLARCLLPAFLCAHIFIKRETSGYEAVATTSLEFEFHLQFPCDSLSNELSDHS